MVCELCVEGVLLGFVHKDLVKSMNHNSMGFEYTSLDVKSESLPVHCHALLAVLG